MANSLSHMISSSSLTQLIKFFRLILESGIDPGYFLWDISPITIGEIPTKDFLVCVSYII